MKKSPVNHPNKKIMIKITARRTYIATLRYLVAGIDALPLDRQQHFLGAELIAAGYVIGTSRHDSKDMPNGNVITGPTVKGRLFLQQLEEEESKASLRSRLIRFGIPIGTYVAGLASLYAKKKLGW